MLTATNDWFLDSLECPKCRAKGVRESLTREDNALQCAAGAHRYPIIAGIPRFIASENGYTDNFGYQWNKFRRTQLDSHSRLVVSRDRFYSQSGWKPEDLRGSRVLDVGCGAGRFTEIAAAAGAHVVAVDSSEAVVACKMNFEGSSNVRVVQADIYHLPFRAESFDFIYCFGVLQHTPDVRGAFFSLPPQLHSGGQIAVDVYRKHWSNWVHPKYWMRPLSKRLSKDRLFRAVERWAPRLLTLSDLLGRLPAGRYLKRLVPIANYRGTLALDDQAILEWAILDTFDWLSPAYDQPQTGETMAAWAAACGLKDIVIAHPAHLTLRARKP